MGPLDTTCARCKGKGVPPAQAAPHFPAAPRSASPPASSQGDLFAAVLCIVMIVLCSAMIYHMVSAIWTHDQLVLTSRSGRNPIAYAPYSVTWWFFIALGLAASGYCGYLLVQVIRKQQQ